MAQPPHSKLPRSLRVLVTPREVFLQIADSGKGFGALLGFLAIEYLLTRPLEAATHLMRASFSLSAAILGLWTAYVQLALVPLVAVFVAGVVLYYALRLRGRPRLDVWSAASVLAYAWVPHVVLVAAGVVVARLGFDHAVLPQYGIMHSTLPPLALVGKAALAFGPSLLLGLIAVRAVWNRGAAPVVRARRVPPLAAPGLAVVLLVAAMGLSGQRVWSDWRQVRPLMPGDHLPAFRVRGLDGPGLVLGGAPGQVVLIDFWASWCGPCVASLPHVQELNHELSGRGFRLLSINVEPDNVAGVRSFVAKHGLDFPVYVDNGSLQRRFQVQSLPTMFLVDPNGVVRDVFIGGASEKTLRAGIEKLLPPASPSAPGEPSR